MLKGIGKVDWFLILPVAILVLISLVTLFSMNPDFFRSQLGFLLVSLIAFLFFSQINLNIIRFYAKPIYFLSIFLLLVVLVLGIESRGSVRWIELLGFRVQFSEILKPFLAVSLASFLLEIKDQSFRNLSKIVLLTLPIGLLIFLQPDLGSALIYFGVVGLTLIYFGFPLKFFLWGAGFFSILAPFFWLFLRDYQRHRIITFLNPASDPLGTSYNVIQSMIAVGSGMLVGRGFGQGTQSSLRFLPERHTDFIFASISEQLGFIGTILVLIAFGFLFYRIYIIFRNSNDDFSRLFGAIAFFIFLVQFFMNAGMNVGVLPVVGVTLPFVSAGGSSLLSNFIILGILSSLSRGKRSEVLEIK